MTTAKQILEDALMYRGPRRAITFRSRVGNNWSMGDLMRAVAMHKTTKDLNATTAQQVCEADDEGVNDGTTGRVEHLQGASVAVSTDIATPNGSGESTGPTSTGPETPKMFTGVGLPGCQVPSEGASSLCSAPLLAQILKAHQMSLLQILNKPVTEEEHANLLINTAGCFRFAGFSSSCDEATDIIHEESLDITAQGARKFTSDLNPNEDLPLKRDWRTRESFGMQSVIGTNKPIPIVAPRPIRIINIAHIASSLNAFVNGTGDALGERRQVSAPAGEVEDDVGKIHLVETGDTASTSSNHEYSRGANERVMHDMRGPGFAPAPASGAWKGFDGLSSLEVDTAAF